MRRALVACAVAVVVARGHAQSEQLREGWQRIADLFAAAAVHPGASIADVGAGEGFLTVRLSPAVGPIGTVYAVDVDPKMTDGLRPRVAAAGLGNVKVIVGGEDDPHLPAGSIDGVLILNAYHEMPHGVVMLTHIREALKPGGRLVLCEPAPRTPGQSRKAQMDDHVLDPELIIGDLRAAGFEVVSRQDDFAMNLGGTHFGFIAAKRL